MTAVNIAARGEWCQLGEKPRELSQGGVLLTRDRTDQEGSRFCGSCGRPLATKERFRLRATESLPFVSGMTMGCIGCFLPLISIELGNAPVAPHWDLLPIAVGPLGAALFVAFLALGVPPLFRRPGKTSAVVGISFSLLTSMALAASWLVMAFSQFVYHVVSHALVHVVPLLRLAGVESIDFGMGLGFYTLLAACSVLLFAYIKYPFTSSRFDRASNTPSMEHITP
jgi:hypothetical protein